MTLNQTILRATSAQTQCRVLLNTSRVDFSPRSELKPQAEAHFQKEPVVAD